MKQEIINRLGTYVSDKYYAQSDWKHDVDALQFKEEPFFWSARENGTTLDFIGDSIEQTLEENEYYRMMCMKDLYTPIAWTLESLHISKPIIILYWDGNDLRKITLDEIKPIFKGLWEERMNQLQHQYPKEWDARNKPIDIEIDESAKVNFERASKLAEELEDDSFSRIIKRMQSWVRMGVNHKVVISNDFAKNSFYFCEVLNDNVRLNGGIIFYPEVTENRWHLHT